MYIFILPRYYRLHVQHLIYISIDMSIDSSIFMETDIALQKLGLKDPKAWLLLSEHGRTEEQMINSTWSVT